MDSTSEQLGTQLLANVEECKFDEILSSLKVPIVSNYAPPIYGLPNVDRLIRILGRDTSPVLELVSTQSGCGKTTLLYYIIASTLSQNEAVGGAAIIFDTDHSFDVHRLATILRQTRITSSQDDVRQALQHVYVYQPASLDVLIATIQQLSHCFFNLESHNSADRKLCIVAIDSASAFFWPNAYAEEANKLEDSPVTPAVHQVSQYARLVAALRAVQAIFHVPVVVTSWALSPIKTRQGGLPQTKSSFPPVWQYFVTLRLVIERDAVTKFTSGMRLEEAEVDRDARHEAVLKAKHTIRVDSQSIEMVSRDNAVAIEQLLKFTFSVDGSGRLVM